ncbi:MAG: class I mannose-6-phosphate isomerase, partial [Candidatus Zixiibacteriota bacterium]
TELVGDFQQKLLGKGMELDPREPFPLLLKFISTGRDLPIQVHPHDAYTLENGLPMVGRDKICYILKVKTGGRLYLGFREKIDEKTIKKAVAGGSLHHLMNSIPLKKGELYTIPAGRIHAVGKGITFIEIQRHSDLTFRLFNWNSKTKKGNDVDYQIEEALKADRAVLIPSATMLIPL